jgi:outer membrane autotransporter protein
VAPGTTNLNTNTHSEYFVDESSTTTNTFLTAEVYALIGATQAIGFAHTSVISGAFDLATRFLRRLGDESDFDDNGVGSGFAAPLAFAPAGHVRDDLPPQLLAYAAMPTKAPAAAPAAPATRYLAWAEGYGVWSRTAAQGTTPGDDRRAAGVAGGFGYRVTPNLRLGFGVDQGRQSIALDAISESANVDLTQVGAHAAFRSGGFVANAAAIYGFGDVGVSRNLPGLVATAAYDVKLWGALGEAGYRLRYGNWRVVPKVGLDWIRVETSAFTEAGAFALTAAGHATDRTRIWGGLEFGQRFSPGPASWLDLSAYGRVVGVVSGQGGPLLPVAFAAAPGVPLTIQGASENDIGFDAGAKAALAITANAVVYAAYDGRFRDGYEAHAASGGIKVRW